MLSLYIHPDHTLRIVHAGATMHIVNDGGRFIAYGSSEFLVGGVPLGRITLAPKSGESFAVEHRGESLKIKSLLGRRGLNRVGFEGPKSFDIGRRKAAS